MASSDSDKSIDSSPSYHPMVLRSACRLCCAVESQSPSLAVGSVTNRRNVHKDHMNGDLLHFHHHHHHHHHHSKDSPHREKSTVKESSATKYSSKTIVSNQSSSTTQQETTTSENSAFDFSKSLDDSSLIEKLTSSFAVAAVAKKLASSTSINCSSTSIYKEIYSDYSSGNESSDFYSGEVNNQCFKGHMSRTRSQARPPLLSSRFASISDSDDDEKINAGIVVSGKHNGSSRTGSLHLMDSRADDCSLKKILHHTNNVKQVYKSAGFRHKNLHSVEGSSGDQLHSTETVVQEEFSTSASSQLPPFPYSDSIFNMFRWLFWRCIYLNACDLLIFDTWILSRSHTFGQKKLLLLLLLLFIPLWFLGAFFTENYTTGDLHTHLPVLQSSESTSSLFSYLSSSMWFWSKNEKSDSQANYSDNSETVQSMWSKVWNFFRVEEVNSVKSDLSASGKSDMKISIESTEMSDEKIRLLALEVFKKESSQLIEQLEKSRKQNQDNFEQASMKMVHGEISSVNSQYQALSDSLQILKLEIKEQLKSDTAENVQRQPQLMLLNSRLQDLEEKLVSFETLLASAKNCCANQSDSLLAEAHLSSLLMKVMEGHEDENHPVLSAFQSWLRSGFVRRENLSDEIASMIKHMYGDTLSQEHYENIARRVAEAVISKSMKSLEQDVINMSKSTSFSISEDHYAQGGLNVDSIQKIVKEAILLYDADKTGRVDYALESGGGSIISTRCSETYNAGTAKLSVLGLPLWYTSRSPRTAIQPEVQPGECWAFHGSRGFLVIQLSATIQPTGVTVEHISKLLSPTGSIDSAPKEFSVWGLTAENDEGKLLGEFMYDRDGDPLQYFPLEGNVEDYYSVIELKIHSNWGNQKYTCLYRFRVHGAPL